MDALIFLITKYKVGCYEYITKHSKKYILCIINNKKMQETERNNKAVQIFSLKKNKIAPMQDRTTDLQFTRLTLYH